jgi:hypothetical protein
MPTKIITWSWEEAFDKFAVLCSSRHQSHLRDDPHNRAAENKQRTFCFSRRRNSCSVA